MIQDNEKVPISWQGRLNVTYSFGGRLSENKSLSLTVFSNLKISKTYNVIGVLKGNVEPGWFANELKGNFILNIYLRSIRNDWCTQRYLVVWSYRRYKWHIHFIRNCKSFF